MHELLESDGDRKRGGEMTERDFCYWLKGYLDAEVPDEVCVDVIRERLKKFLNSKITNGITIDNKLIGYGPLTIPCDGKIELSK